MNNLCYNCRQIINNSSREHIPAKAFFAGYSEEYLINGITVPACVKCNFEYSKIDNHLRDAIGIMNDENDLQDILTAKSVRSILRQPNWKDRIITNQDGKVYAVRFDYHDIIDIQIKNFKGLFFHEFGYPIPEEYTITAIVEGSEEESRFQFQIETINSILLKDAIWKKSGHEKIFKYIIKSLDQEYSTDKTNFNLDQTKIFAAVMDYHEQQSCFVIANKA